MKPSIAAMTAVIASCIVAVGTVAAEEFRIEVPMSALEFRIGSNFELETFEGTAISWKQEGSENRAWRLGISPSINTGNSNSDVVPGITRTSESESYRLGVTWQLLFTRPVEHRTRFYWGIGPDAGFRYYERKSADPSAPDTEERKSLDRSYWLGLAGTVGVEYFFTQTMSLMGEYESYISYLHEFRSYPGSSTTNENWTFGSRGARLGLAVRF